MCDDILFLTCEDCLARWVREYQSKLFLQTFHQRHLVADIVETHSQSSRRRPVPWKDEQLLKCHSVQRSHFEVEPILEVEKVEHC